MKLEIGGLTIATRRRTNKKERKVAMDNYDSTMNRQILLSKGKESEIWALRIAWEVMNGAMTPEELEELIITNSKGEAHDCYIHDFLLKKGLEINLRYSDGEYDARDTESAPWYEWMELSEKKRDRLCYPSIQLYYEADNDDESFEAFYDGAVKGESEKAVAFSNVFWRLGKKFCGFAEKFGQKSFVQQPLEFINNRMEGNLGFDDGGPNASFFINLSGFDKLSGKRQDEFLDILGATIDNLNKAYQGLIKGSNNEDESKTKKPSGQKVLFDYFLEAVRNQESGTARDEILSDVENLKTDGFTPDEILRRYRVRGKRTDLIIAAEAAMKADQSKDVESEDGSKSKDKKAVVSNDTDSKTKDTPKHNGFVRTQTEWRKDIFQFDIDCQELFESGFFDGAPAKTDIFGLMAYYAEKRPGEEMPGWLKREQTREIQRLNRKAKKEQAGS